VLSMDRIYYRGLDISDCHRLHGQPWSKLSDHTPLLAEFSLV
jgi:endonuclease/exonuclease/phosphatase (EEP) superfamily protein YafD